MTFQQNFFAPKSVSSVSVFEKDSQNKIQLPDIAWQYSFDNGQLELSNYQWWTSEVPKDILDDGFLTVKLEIKNFQLHLSSISDVLIQLSQF